jgi:octaprenyl-diphosphate synthase
MLPFYAVVKAEFDAVNALIIKALHSDVRLVEDVGHYLVQAGGKRLRPLLALLSAGACGYRGDQHITLAAVIEFIHTATLLHDDVVDTSELRRGRYTANAQWGNAPSVLVGDFLYSRAFQMMVAMGDLAVMAILADTTNIISEGEVQQLANARNPDITEADYNEVIGKKTAQLFEGAAFTGATLAKADANCCGALKAFGYHLGMAFQLVDDALDYQGSTAELGKNVGDDLAEGKATLPLIRAMQTGASEQTRLIRAAIRCASRESLDDILLAIRATDALEYTMTKARGHAEQATACLAPIPASRYREAMLELTAFALERTN